MTRVLQRKIKTARRRLSPAQKVWQEKVDSTEHRPSRDLDGLWRKHKQEHGFDPKDFDRVSPWCSEGAQNNRWAKRAFLGDPKREAAWSLLGYSDRPFDFAYLWLDFAGFSGLLRSKHLPVTIEKSRGDLKREAGLLADQCRRLSKNLGKWAFSEAVLLEKLLTDEDYWSASTVRIFGEKATKLNTREQHVAVQAVRDGIRVELRIPLGGKRSILDRAADTLTAWQPPPSLVDRPHRAGLKQRYAARWLDQYLASLGGDLPVRAQVVLVTELMHALAELGEWPEEPWDEERVRRCLDGKSHKKKRDSV